MHGNGGNWRLAASRTEYYRGLRRSPGEAAYWGLLAQAPIWWRERLHAVNPITVSSSRACLGHDAAMQKREAPKRGTDRSGLCRVDAFWGIYTSDLKQSRGQARRCRNRPFRSKSKSPARIGPPPSKTYALIRSSSFLS
jgi:hypothetical protein